jgi:hypothetical protein
MVERNFRWDLVTSFQELGKVIHARQRIPQSAIAGPGTGNKHVTACQDHVVVSVRATSLATQLTHFLRFATPASFRAGEIFEVCGLKLWIARGSRSCWSVLKRADTHVSCQPPLLALIPSYTCNSSMSALSPITNIQGRARGASPLLPPIKTGLQRTVCFSSFVHLPLDLTTSSAEFSSSRSGQESRRNYTRRIYTSSSTICLPDTRPVSNRCLAYFQSSS